jgi:hypothetical protein
MPRIYKIVFFSLLLILPANVLATGLKAWAAAREIQFQGGYPYKEFMVDPMIYRLAKEDLSDLRIIDKDGAFIPYYIQDASRRTLWFPHETRHSGNLSTITLLNTDRLQIVSLRIMIDENHQRQYRVLADGKQIASGELVKLQLQGTNILRNTIHFKSFTRAEKIVIEIDNRDDRPLTIEEIRIEYQIHQVIFQDVNTSPYTLYYGNRNAEQPVYDIDRYRGYIEKEPKSKVRLGEQAAVDLPAEPPDLNVVFNIVIVAVSLFLVLLLARQLSATKE